jgi:hypothetical protein
MNHFTYVTLGLCAALTLSACNTDQGPSGAGATPAAVQPAYPVTVPPTAHEQEPAPVSQTHPNKEAFQGAEYIEETSDDLNPQIPNAKRIDMLVGQVVQVYHAVALPGDGKPQMAFFLPCEARSVVQLVVERNGIYVDYYVKALAVGDTVGGVVERSWLDGRGFDPLSDADMARIQAAIKTTPYLISVR